MSVITLILGFVPEYEENIRAHMLNFMDFNLQVETPNKSVRMCEFDTTSTQNVKLNHWAIELKTLRQIESLESVNIYFISIYNEKYSQLNENILLLSSKNKKNINICFFLGIQVQK